MKTTSLISLHQKAIKTLEAIETAESRIRHHQSEIPKIDKLWRSTVEPRLRERIEINTRIISRLSIIYSNLLVRIITISETQIND